MKNTRILAGIWILLAIVLVSAATLRGQTKLEENEGLTRLIGNWVASGDDGQIFNLNYRWGLNKNIVVSRFDMAGLYSGYGLTYYDPAEGKIIQVGVDSIGGCGRGQWHVAGDKTVWKMKYVGPDSEQRNVAVVYERTDRKTLKTKEYYDLGDDGKLAGEPTRTTEYKRKARKPSERDKGKKSRQADASGTSALADLVDMGGFDWMIGNWVATTDEGQSLNSAYRWSMNKNVINMTFKMGDYEGIGLIFYSPQDGKVMQVGADSRGVAVKGSWDAEEDNLVATLDFAAADGNKGKIAIVHANIDAKTMKASFYGVDESGERAGEPRGTMEYKRQRKKTGTKAKKAKTE